MQTQPTACQSSTLTDDAVTLPLCWCAPAAQMNELPLCLIKEGCTNGSSCLNDLTLLCTPVGAWFVFSFCVPVVLLDRTVGVCAHVLNFKRTKTQHRSNYSKDLHCFCCQAFIAFVQLFLSLPTYLNPERCYCRLSGKFFDKVLG